MQNLSYSISDYSVVSLIIAVDIIPGGTYDF